MVTRAIAKKIVQLSCGLAVAGAMALASPGAAAATMSSYSGNPGDHVVLKLTETNDIVISGITFRLSIGSGLALASIALPADPSALIFPDSGFADGDYVSIGTSVPVNPSSDPFSIEFDFGIISAPGEYFFSVACTNSDFCGDPDYLPQAKGTITIARQGDGQVPEPGTLALLGSSLLGLAAIRRRNGKSS